MALPTRESFESNENKIRLTSYGWNMIDSPNRELVKPRNSLTHHPKTFFATPRIPLLLVFSLTASDFFNICVLWWPVVINLFRAFFFSWCHKGLCYYYTQFPSAFHVHASLTRSLLRLVASTADYFNILRSLFTPRFPLDTSTISLSENYRQYFTATFLLLLIRILLFVQRNGFPASHLPCHSFERTEMNRNGNARKKMARRAFERFSSTMRTIWRESAGDQPSQISHSHFAFTKRSAARARSSNEL